MTTKEGITNEQANENRGQSGGERWLHMYRQMRRIRWFEQNANELYLSAKMPGLTHLSVGQEAVAVGVCEALQPTDYITSTHRGHGHCLAKGAKLDLMFAELLGKAPGYCRGKGGSMHIADQEHGNLGANAIVGAGAAIATGAAFSAKMLGNQRVAVCFVGEGALGQGLLYEVMNMAALWRLPVLYLCENNFYNEYTHFTQTTAGEILARPAAFGIPAKEVDGQDVKAVFAQVSQFVDRLRNGDGPAFLLCHTYRVHGHHVGDINRTYYRSKEEEQEWKAKRDPLQIHRDWLLQEQYTNEEELAAMDREIQAEAEAAVQFALSAPYPDLTEVDQHVYA